MTPVTKISLRSIAAVAQPCDKLHCYTASQLISDINFWLLLYNAAYSYFHISIFNVFSSVSYTLVCLF